MENVLRYWEASLYAVVNNIEPCDGVAIGSDVELGCDTAVRRCWCAIIVRINHTNPENPTTLQVQRRKMG